MRYLHEKLFRAKQMIATLVGISADVWVGLALADLLGVLDGEPHR